MIDRERKNGLDGQPGVRSRRSIAIGFCLAIVCLASAPAAQPHGTDLITTHSPGLIIRTTMGGTSTTLASGVGTGILLNMVTMDVDNQHFVLLDSTSTPTPQVLRFDPGQGKVVATVWNGTPLGTSTSQSWIDVDQDGDYLVADGANVFKLKADGSRITTLLTLTNSGASIECFAEDLSSGDWVVGANAPSPPGNSIFQVDRLTGQVTSIVPLPRTPATMSQPTGMAQDPHANTVFVSVLSFGGIDGLFGYDPVLATITTLHRITQANFRFNAITADRSPDASGALIYTVNALPAGLIQKLDRRGTVIGTVTPGPSGVRSGFGITFDQSRNLAPSLSTAPNDRLIHVHFPGDAGKLYVMAFSLSGSKPGLPLPDGRVIPLFPDALTFLTAQSAFPPFVTNNHGQLDPSGRATVRLNANPLGGAARGVRIWAAALTLDSAAPLGIGRISGPVLFVLN
jgi:hypothetical protein